MTTALVIGAGPAGLMAADVLSKAGVRVVVTEAKPSVGRKFLMAGKSGLNLTKDVDRATLIAGFNTSAQRMSDAIAGFDAQAVGNWSRALGQPVFTGSSSRVFPASMKASPLLRAWLAQMDIDLRTRWQWRGWQDGAALFDTPDGAQVVDADVTILAMGGASWARLGSDGAWAAILRDKAVQIVGFGPVNMGFKVDWSAHMAPHFGTPVKGVALHAGGQTERAEFVVSQRGIEGGGIYLLSKAMRDGAPLTVDLLPDMTLENIRERLARRGKDSIGNVLRKKLKLHPIKQALLMEFGRPLPDDLAPLIKALPIRHDGPREMDEAISTSGGVAWDALDDGLMLKACEGVFCAGEMIDWDAPTGGYLITGCLATGQHAGRAAVRYLQAREQP